MNAAERAVNVFEEPASTYSGRIVAGRYHVLACLGQGGIGRVYAADQIGLDRRVAVKVIRPDRKDDPVTEARFLREARAAGRISSPHVVTLYDCGRDRRDLYIAMELLEGVSLAKRLCGGPALTPIEAIEVAARVARGLHAAHEAGVLHRDLKPGNVFLCRDGGVKVLDFGIAKIVDDSTTDALTGVHRIVGTPRYMSPEAALRLPLGPSSDLYALGVLLFEMIVGTPPFRTGEAMKTLRAHIDRPPPGLAASAPWVHVPDELDALVASLLEKDPAKRPQHAIDVARSLERIASQLMIETTAVHERREPTIEEVNETIEAPKPRVSVAATALAAAALGTAIFALVIAARLFVF
jgi:eukaryotic-like serine/threonine-protein kinase